MTALRRLLKTTLLRSLLDEACAIARPGTRFLVVAEGVALAVCGDAPVDLPAALASPLTLSFPLLFEGRLLGHLIIIPPDDLPYGGPDAGGLAALGRLLAHSLTLIIEQEHARRSVVAETLDKYREIELLHTATLSLNTSLRLRDVSRALLAECQKAAIPADMGMVFVRQGKEGSFTPLHAFGQAVAFGLGKVGASRLFAELVAAARSEVVNDPAQDPRWGGEAPDVRALLIAPLHTPSHCVGCLVLASGQPATFEAAHLKRISTIASVAAISMGNAYHFEGMQGLMDALLQALAASIDARDPYTSGHSQRVAVLSVELARQVNHDEQHFPDFAFSEGEVHELYYGGLLHDVGKIGVREQVLTKNSRLPPAHLEVIAMRLALHARENGGDWQSAMDRLTRINTAGRLTPEDVAFVSGLAGVVFQVDDTLAAPMLSPAEVEHLTVRDGNLTAAERFEIERHPAESYRILQHIPFTDNFALLLTLIHQHHERLDGTGYPSRLKARDILLQSRILAITDIFDAITQERHYKPALDRDEALGVLRQEAARGRIDARLTDIFIANIDAIERNAAAFKPTRTKPEPPSDAN